jgi:hypothetical protein
MFSNMLIRSRLVALSYRQVFSAVAAVNSPEFWLTMQIAMLARPC